MAFSLVPDKDPEVLFSLPVIKRFSSEVYNAALPHSMRNPAGIPLGVLASGVGRYLAANSSPPPKVAGPLSALHKTLARANWDFVSPLVLRSQSGQHVHLPSVCPSRVVDLFRGDLHNTIIDRAVRKKCATQGIGLGDTYSHGVCFKPLVTLYNKMGYVEKSALIKTVSSGFITNSTLVNMGYDIDPTCKLCNAACDTAFHRCITCPMIEARAKVALGINLYNKILDAGESSLLFRCVFPMPMFKSLPSSSTLFETIGMSSGDLLNEGGSKVFGDGSCFHPNVAQLARAGFAVVQVNAEGDILRAIYGCVPRSLPQTSLSAEYAAFLCAAENCRDATYLGDCQDVIDCFHKGLGPAMRSRTHPHADSWRIMRHRFGDSLSPRIAAAVKVKAHLGLDDVISGGGDVVNYWGNFHADDLAKRGANLHKADDDDIAAYRALKNDVTSLARHIVDTMGTLRLDRISNPVRAPRLPVLPVVRDSAAERHSYRWQGKMWICITCLFRTHSPSLVPKSRQVCTGSNPLSIILSDSNGHKLWTASLSGGGAIAYCTKCWCYASAYPRKLGEPCKGVPLKSRHSKHFLMNRKHPVSRVQLLRPCPLHDGS